MAGVVLGVALTAGWDVVKDRTKDTTQKEDDRRSITRLMSVSASNNIEATQKLTSLLHKERDLPVLLRSKLSVMQSLTNDCSSAEIPDMEKVIGKNLWGEIKVYCDSVDNFNALLAKREAVVDDSAFDLNLKPSLTNVDAELLQLLKDLKAQERLLKTHLDASL